MRKTDAEESWAVYQVVKGKQAGIKVVCRDSEWRALASSHPDANVLIQAGITDENEADKLARGTSGDAKPRSGTAALAPGVEGRRIIKRENDS